jgi:hypothetical protein
MPVAQTMAGGWTIHGSYSIISVITETIHDLVLLNHDLEFLMMLSTSNIQWSSRPCDIKKLWQACDTLWTAQPKPHIWCCTCSIDGALRMDHIEMKTNRRNLVPQPDVCIRPGRPKTVLTFFAVRFLQYINHQGLLQERESHPIRGYVPLHCCHEDNVLGVGPHLPTGERTPPEDMSMSLLLPVLLHALPNRTHGLARGGQKRNPESSTAARKSLMVLMMLVQGPLSPS